VQRAAERDYQLPYFDLAGTYARALRERGRRPEDGHADVTMGAPAKKGPTLRSDEILRAP
jgi:hypothetical protein